MRWMKIRAACEHAGDSNPKLLYKAAASGALKVARVGAGRNLLFCAEWLDEWLTRSATDTAGQSRGTAEQTNRPAAATPPESRHPLDALRGRRRAALPDQDQPTV